MNDFHIDDEIEVIELNSSQQKKRRKPYHGEIFFIDLKGLLYGSWGHFTIDPTIDKIKKVIKKKRTLIDFLKKN